MYKSKFVYIYYLIIVSILALWTNMTHSPNLLVRVGFLAAIIIPLFNKIELFPSVIICILVISKNSFAYPILPTEVEYYIVFALLFVTISVLRNKNTFSGINLLYILILLYLLFNDLVFQNHISKLTQNTFLFVLFYFCVGQKVDYSVKHLNISFLVISIVLSCWILFAVKAQVNVYNSAGDMEQVGWTDPNYLGIAVGMGTVIGIKELMLKTGEKLYYALCIFVIIISLIALAKIASRGALLSVFVGLFFIVTTSKVKLITKILFIISITILLFILYNNSYFDFVLARIENDEGTGSGRTEIWSEKLRLMYEEQSPLRWFFGIGQEQALWLGNFGRARAFHSDYVALLVEYGFIGFLLFIMILIYPIRIASNKIRPTIMALILYIMTCSITIEPLTFGNLAYLGFYFYITQLARYSNMDEYSASQVLNRYEIT